MLPIPAKKLNHLKNLITLNLLEILQRSRVYWFENKTSPYHVKGLYWIEKLRIWAYRWLEYSWFLSSKLVIINTCLSFIFYLLLIFSPLPRILRLWWQGEGIMQWSWKYSFYPSPIVDGLNWKRLSNSRSLKLCRILKRY